MEYRAEIDGLRAVAVVPVVLFHAGFEFFQGGFVGVDIFFVISGYLITLILMEELAAGNFSIANFYERRARRILPALFLVMLVCVPFAWVTMLPDEMESFSKSLIAVSLFFSNILFWRETNYFAAAAEEKPLLHSWSLAVEEQYYLIFPIFLMLLWRRGIAVTFWCLLIVSLCSFAAAEIGLRYQSKAAFFLSPARAWELLAGSLAALFVYINGVQRNKFLALLGLVLIIFSIVYFSSRVPFPGLYAVVPVAGAVLVIIFGGKGTIVEKLLGSTAFVSIGLISYSLYLWHQPLLAFARLFAPSEPSLYVAGGLSGLSFLLAWISWRFVETPFRDRAAWDGVSIAWLSGICTLFFCVLGLIGFQTNGFKSRFPPGEIAFLEQISSENSNYVVRRFNELERVQWQEGKRKVFLVGDSYAQDLVNAVYESDVSAHLSLSTWYISAKCGNLMVPFSLKDEYINPADFPRCRRTDIFSDQDFIERLRGADEVWFASSWRPWQVDLVSQSLGNVRKVSAAVIRVFGRKDFPGFESRKYLGLTPEERQAFSEPLSEQAILENLKLAAQSKGHEFIDVQSIMCGGDPRACSVFDRAGNAKTYDGGHLTPHGAKFYGVNLRDILIE